MVTQCRAKHLCRGSRSDAYVVLRVGCYPWTGGYGCRPQSAPDGGPSPVHGENRLHDEPEAPQYAKQFAVAEGLASRGEARAPGWLLEQRVRSERLKERGLLIVGVAVDHAVRPAEGSRGVD